MFFFFFFLYRTTTLDDIQHQLNHAANNLKSSDSPIRRQMLDPAAKSPLEAYETDEDSDSGDITGYAYDSSYNDSNYFNVSIFPNRLLYCTYFY